MSPGPCSLPASHAEPPFSHQAASPTLALISVLLATHTGLEVEFQLDKDEVEQMQKCEEFLHQEMTRLLQEMEGSSGTMENLLSSAWQLLWLPWLT